MTGPAAGQAKQKPPGTVRFQGAKWQRMKDSNPHKQSQSLVCYHYTNPLYAAFLRSQMLL